MAWGLSAGRVQSVAVRLLVQRERARRAFRSGSYWDLKASLDQAGNAFEAKLTHVAGKRVASGNDFDENTGGLKAGVDVRLLREDEARALADKLRSSPWTVDGVDEKPTVRKPVPPFTTSTLQQEANRKLRLSARETMRCAQGNSGASSLTSHGFRHLSDQAISASRSCVKTLYGSEYLSKGPRQFSTKTRNTGGYGHPSGEAFRRLRIPVWRGAILRCRADLETHGRQSDG